MIKLLQVIILSFFTVFGLVGCNDNVMYTAHEDIPDGLWYINTNPKFEVEIKDITIKYNLYYLIRNTQQYPYYNLYLTRQTKEPTGASSSTLQEVYISDETTGKPFGTGLGDLFDHKIPFLTNYTFQRSGTYTFTISQSMRQNPLPFIMSVGLAVEKVQEGEK